ncbi:MAG: hypothetical protein Q9192_004787, partial [Flavoplaca navasiana]
SSGRSPVLAGGDVEIWLTRKPEDRLLLHSVVLSLHSKWFDASLSEGWTDESSKSLDHVVKWRYELEFEDEKTAALVKRSDSPHTVTSLSADATDDLYFHGNGFSSAHLDNKQHKYRETLVKAYRCYFGVMYHLPIEYDYDSSKPMFADKVRAFIAMIVEIGDFYDGLQFLTGPVENLLKTFVLDYPFNLYSCYNVLPQMSLKLRSGWLYKEAVCGLAGQEYYDDDELRDHLPSEMASLVMQKRASFRQMLRDLDQEILTLENPDYDVGGDPDVIQIASSWYRQFIFVRLLKVDVQAWYGIPYKYRTLVVRIRSIDYNTELQHYLFESKQQRSCVYGLLRSMLDEASKKIRQSFANDSAWFEDELELDKNAGCIKVHDEELPWNERLRASNRRLRTVLITERSIAKYLRRTRKQTSNDGPDVLFFRENVPTPTSLSKQELAAYLGMVVAHLQYLKALYYIPFSVSFNPIGNGLQQTSRLVETVVLYDSLEAFRVQIECQIIRQVDVVRQSLQLHGPAWLQIATKLDIAWFFKE